MIERRSGPLESVRKAVSGFKVRHPSAKSRFLAERANESSSLQQEFGGLMQSHPDHPGLGAKWLRNEQFDSQTAAQAADMGLSGSMRRTGKLVKSTLNHGWPVLPLAAGVVMTGIGLAKGENDMVIAGGLVATGGLGAGSAEAKSVIQNRRRVGSGEPNVNPQIIGIDEL